MGVETQYKSQKTNISAYRGEPRVTRFCFSTIEIIILKWTEISCFTHWPTFHAWLADMRRDNRFYFLPYVSRPISKFSTPWRPPYACVAPSYQASTSSAWNCGSVRKLLVSKGSGVWWRSESSKWSVKHLHKKFEHDISSQYGFRAK